MSGAINDTVFKFGYPRNLIAEYRDWMVLLRPQQSTLGALALVSLGEARSFAELSSQAFAELAQITSDVEAALHGVFRYDKINYLMLMMVDPHVHFHVLPRYGAPREFADMRFADPGWPGPPDLSQAPAVADDAMHALIVALREAWPRLSLATTSWSDGQKRA